MGALCSPPSTGASWWCYFRALHAGDATRVAPPDKLSVVLVALFGVGFNAARAAPPDAGPSGRPVASVTRLSSLAPRLGRKLRMLREAALRSEERRVGKECRSRW